MPTDPLAAACHDLVQIYPSAGGSVAALRGIDAEFPTGTITVVIGPSGAGKSTFLRALACLERPAAGEVSIGGQPTAGLRGRARRRLAARGIGYVFQRPADNLLEYLDVAEHVGLAARMRGQDHPDLAPLLDASTLDAVRAHRPPDLSAGEQQRLAFAMAVAGDPSLVIADEPSAELDPAATDALVDLLAQLTRRGGTFVISSHDPAVMRAADQLLMIRNGSLAARGTGADDALLAAIDPSGRIQLPEAAAALFPDGRARLTVGDRSIQLERPQLERPQLEQQQLEEP